MRNNAILFQIILLAGMVSLASLCIQKKEAAAENKITPTMRYGKNGVPNFIKGDNLSAPLDGESAFQQLKSQKKYAQIAFYYLDRHRPLFKLTSAKKEFVLEEIDSDPTGQTHVRLMQVFNEIPVWGMALKVHLNSYDQIYHVHGSYQPISSGLTTQTTITDSAAAQIALRSKNNSSQWRIDGVDKCIYAPSNQIQHLSYKVNLLHNALYREYCFVDAVDGRLLHCVSKTTRARGL